MPCRNRRNPSRNEQLKMVLDCHRISMCFSIYCIFMHISIRASAYYSHIHFRLFCSNPPNKYSSISNVKESKNMPICTAIIELILFVILTIVIPLFRFSGPCNCKNHTAPCHGNTPQLKSYLYNNARSY